LANCFSLAFNFFTWSSRSSWLLSFYTVLGVDGFMVLGGMSGSISWCFVHQCIWVVEVGDTLSLECLFPCLGFAAGRFTVKVGWLLFSLVAGLFVKPLMVCFSSFLELSGGRVIVRAVWLFFTFLVSWGRLMFTVWVAAPKNYHESSVAYGCVS
jgi:hypothetical protein